MKLKVLMAICVALVGFVVVAPASARWRIGNGPADIEINEVSPPAFSNQVCTTHVEGRAGLSTEIDPAVTPPPPGPYDPLTVELFTGPPASLDGAQGAPGGILLADGTTLVAPIASVTTAPPTLLSQPEEYTNNGNTPIWEYAAAPFSFTLAPGAVAPGNDVAFRQSGHVAITVLNAVTCSTPPSITAVIDVLPGIASNPVIPSLRLPILPVRVFGSATLDVTKIATVKLGNASAVAIPPWLVRLFPRLFAPRDRNGDGYLDRDYFFAPASTGIACGATSVNLTGTLSGGGTFSGTDAIKTVHC